MKKIILITILIVSYSCKAQENKILSEDLTINGKLIFGMNKSDLILNFGTPTKIEKGFSEMDESDMYFYKYDNDLDFTLIDNTVDTFRVLSNKYNFTKHNIKIGDDINKLKSLYPLSYQNKSNDGIKLLFSDLDMFLIISFSNNIIDKIYLHNY